jgi:hypothetical protein
MNVSAFIYKTAWLPLTPRGVAAFATAKTRRLLLVQFVFAVLACSVVGWFLDSQVAPTLRSAIESLPDKSQISSGVLAWPTNAPQPALLAEGRVLSVAVDLDQTGAATSSSDLRLQLGRSDWQVASFFGVLHVPGLLDTSYPLEYTVALNRADLLPWWGAREPYLLGIVIVVTGVCLFLSWWVLAVLYAPFVWLGAFYGNRVITLAGCWRLAGAALMPGAVFMVTAIALYGLGAFDLMRLALAWGMHLVTGWFYLVVSTAALPRLPSVSAPGENPFVPPRE